MVSTWKSAGFRGKAQCKLYYPEHGGRKYLLNSGNQKYTPIYTGP